MTDTKVGCTVCGREQEVGFGNSLKTGWPKCCGYTMRLMRTDADIEAVTRAALGAIAPPSSETDHVSSPLDEGA